MNLFSLNFSRSFARTCIVNKICPVGKVFSKIFKATENLMKLPLTSINWAIGRRRERNLGPEETPESAETKRNYGGTDDISMHKLDKTNR